MWNQKDLSCLWESYMTLNSDQIPLILAFLLTSGCAFSHSFRHLLRSSLVSSLSTVRIWPCLTLNHGMPLSRNTVISWHWQIPLGKSMKQFPFACNSLSSFNSPAMKLCKKSNYSNLFWGTVLMALIHLSKKSYPFHY